MGTGIGRARRRIATAIQLGACALCFTACDAPAPDQQPSASAASAKTAAVADSGAPDHVTQSRQLVARFGGELKQALMDGMSHGGPVNAIGVCSDKAPTISASLSSDGWTIRRTSLRLRNSKNAPDSWERGVLQRFEEDKKRGTPIDKLEAHEIVTRDGSRELRYMKAIGTAALCLTCHGSSLSKEITSALDERYPNDKARDFEVGDLRGAFSVTKRL